MSSTRPLQAHEPGIDWALRAGLLGGLLDALPDAAWLVDLHTRTVVAANAAAHTLFARPQPALVGESATSLAAAPEDLVWWAEAEAGRATPLHSDTVLCTPDGRTLHVRRSIRPLRLPGCEAAAASHALVVLADRSAGHADQQRIEALSVHDPLTGLANRRRLTEQVAAAVARAQRDGTSLALLVVDLDRFRHINDSLGHAVGDRALLEVAQRIQGCLRQDDLLARLGGDQFAVVVSPADAAAAEVTARRVLKVVAQPSSFEGAPFTLTCSIGVALAPSHGSSADELLRHAEAAMRAVKAAGRADYRLHQARAEVDRRSHMLLDHAMRQALVSGRFRLHYQPQVGLADGRIIGAEALLRWRDPEMGEILPARFITVAEDSGFIVPIGDWVLSQAVRQLALWHSKGLSMPVAVNVSALQFQQAHFVDRVANVLAVSGVPPQLLELELTESILVHDADEALHRLRALARLGVKLSIDDFGTGYSSLAYLRRFPIGKLKIDRSFISGLPGDQIDAGIVRAILQMARALGMRVTAEGVETEAQRSFLHEAGCDEFQGFLFAPALDALSFEQRLPAGGPAASAAGAALKPRIRLVR